METNKQSQTKRVLAASYSTLFTEREVQDILLDPHQARRNRAIAEAKVSGFLFLVILAVALFCK